MPGEGDELLFGFIEVPFDFCIVGGAPAPVFGVMRWWLILGHGDVGVDFLSLADDAMEEILVFFLLMAGAPLMEMAIDAVFNLDMHVLN